MLLPARVVTVYRPSWLDGVAAHLARSMALISSISPSFLPQNTTACLKSSMLRSFPSLT